MASKLGLVESRQERREARANKRKATWQGGVTSHANAAQADLRFWHDGSGAMRLWAVWELAQEHYGKPNTTPRFSRSVGGVRTR